jgi:hypothetical protein
VAPSRGTSGSGGSKSDAKPAPPAQSGNNNNDGGGGGKVPRHPVTVTPPANNPAPGSSRGPALQPNPHNPNPPQRPGSAEDARKIAERQREAQNKGNRTLSNNPNRIVVVGVPALNSWAPYSWWFNGNSYWWPPVDNRDDSGYRNDTTSSANSTSPTTPATPPADVPAQTQVQAQSLNQLEGMPEYRRLMAELKKAQNQYETASARAIEKVKANPEYQALVKERDQAQDKVEAVQASAKIPPVEQVTPAAEKKLDVSAKITRMEQEAIAADPQASAAKARMVELNEMLTGMRKQAQTGGAR